MPRALLSADPAFMALKQAPAVAGLLHLREQWLGGGALSPARFLFHPAGDVYLVRWAAGEVPIAEGCTSRVPLAHASQVPMQRTSRPADAHSQPVCACVCGARRWSAEGGHRVRLLAPHSLQAELKLDVAALRSSPVRQPPASERAAAELSRGWGAPLQLGGLAGRALCSGPAAVRVMGCAAPHAAAPWAGSAALPPPLQRRSLPLLSPQLALMQAVLDHHHGSYSSELRAAGLAAAKREEATVAAAGASADAAEFPGSGPSAS